MYALACIDKDSINLHIATVRIDAVDDVSHRDRSDVARIFKVVGSENVFGSLVKSLARTGRRTERGGGWLRVRAVESFLFFVRKGTVDDLVGSDFLDGFFDVGGGSLDGDGESRGGIRL